MQIIRTLMWIAITIVLVAFIAMNWERAPVNIWPLQSGYLYSYAFWMIIGRAVMLGYFLWHAFGF